MPAPRFPKPAGEPAGPITWPDRVLRMFGGLVLVAVGVSLLLYETVVRADEASLAGHWFGLFLAGPVQTSRDLVFFDWSKGPLVAVQITQECTVALLAGPLLFLGAGLLAFTRAAWHRLLVGLAVGLAVVIAVNQVRLALIAVSTQHWGISGYDVSHKFVGTVLVLAGFTLAVLLTIRIAVRTRRGAHAGG